MTTSYPVKRHSFHPNFQIIRAFSSRIQQQVHDALKTALKTEFLLLNPSVSLYIYSKYRASVWTLCEKVEPPLTFNMSDSVAELEKLLESELQTFLSHHNNEKQPSESRRSRQLQDPHDGGQPSGARHSRPLEVPNDGKQPSGNKTWKSGAGKRNKRPLEMLIAELISF